ncbi:MAG: CHAT domain-containing protein [Acidobacteriota bacterium]
MESSGHQLVELPAQDRLGRGVRHLHSLLSSKNRSPVATRQAAREASALTNLLLGPAQAELTPGRPVAIVADGELSRLPFTFLTRPGSEGPTAARLVDHHALTVTPSVSIVRALRSRQPERQLRQTQRLHVFADAVYSAADPRLSTSGVFDTSSNNGLERLEASGHQAKKLMERWGATSRVGFEATKSAVLKGALADTRYLHFGTHASVDLGAPELSAIELSRFGPEGSPLDGKLRLRDLDRIALAADLVTLAGCRTALGPLVPGEGLLALPRGFLHAGAASVVASLWEVSDQAAAALTDELYTQLIEHGRTPREALRRAQLKLSRDDRWKDPYFWAGYVLIGDWDLESDPTSPRAPPPSTSPPLPAR